MVLLDTSVVSELMRLLPDPGVESWIRSQSADGLFFSAIGEAELRINLSDADAAHATFADQFRAWRQRQ